MEDFKILKDLVGFNTIKDFQNKEIMDYIENYLQKLGFKTENKTKNLIMSIGNKQNLGFLGHTDTVEYIDEFKEPFYDNVNFLENAKTANFITEASMINNCNQRIILGVGPVTAHEVNEHISMQSYRNLVEQYKEIIYKICGDE